MQSADEFYVGWAERSPRRIAQTTRRALILVVLGLAILGAGLARSQRTVESSVFEWGRIKTFTGVLESSPCPRLLVPRPGARAPVPDCSSYYLVRPFKFGLTREDFGDLDHRAVTLRGTLIYRDGQTMIEVVPGSIAPDPAPPPTATATLAAVAGPNRPTTPDAELGEQTLRGEIMDSKCFFGVMNPGALTPHRACAIRCLSGGVPPVLLVRLPDHSTRCFLLVSRSGEPVNREILPLVALPVQITGNVQRYGDLWVLRANPTDFRRVPE